MDASLETLSGLPKNRIRIWRHRGSEPSPAAGDAWERFSPFHALLLALVGEFVDEHACPPDRAEDVVSRAVPELFRQWNRLPDGLAVVLIARPSGKETPRYALEVKVCLPPVSVRLGTDVVASFSVNATKALREIQVRAEAAGVELPPIVDRDGWCRAMK